MCEESKYESTESELRSEIARLKEMLETSQNKQDPQSPATPHQASQSTTSTTHLPVASSPQQIRTSANMNMLSNFNAQPTSANIPQLHQSYPAFHPATSTWPFGGSGMISHPFSSPPAISTQQPKYISFEDWVASRPPASVQNLAQVDQFVRSWPLLLEKMQQELADSTSQWAQQWRH